MIAASAISPCKIFRVYRFAALAWPSLNLSQRNIVAYNAARLS
jgi:hypothetical protein